MWVLPYQIECPLSELCTRQGDVAARALTVWLRCAGCARTSMLLIGPLKGGVGGMCAAAVSSSRRLRGSKTMYRPRGWPRQKLMGRSRGLHSGASGPETFRSMNGRFVGQHVPPRYGSLLPVLWIAISSPFSSARAQNPPVDLTLR